MEVGEDLGGGAGDGVLARPAAGERAEVHRRAQMRELA
jgi:hypothetical protein